MTKIRVHNPCNEHTRYFRYYNYFWDVLTDKLKLIFDVEENRDFKNAHFERFKINLQKGISDNVLLLECEYLIENLDTGEFVILSVADDLGYATLAEQDNPYLKKVLISQFNPQKILNHTHDNFQKYSPWQYFQAQVIDLEPYYLKRQTIIPSERKLYFRGTSLSDRRILSYIDKDIITDFNPILIDLYFDDIINYKIALSVDGVGEFCYRDIECMALGIPMIRFEYVSKFHNELIPNYHYISIPRPTDMKLYRMGNENHAKMIEQQYYKVINDDDFLSFISKNARQYYEDNCMLDKMLDNTINLLDLNSWIV